MRFSSLARWFTLLAFALALAAPSAAQHHGGGQRRALLENPGIPEILKTALTRGAKARYVGTRIVQWHGWDRKESEIVTREGQKTRVEFPDGSRNQGQIIVEDKDERKHYYPRRNEVLLEPPRREESIMRLLHMAERGAHGNLQFGSGHGERIAGYDTELLTIGDLNGNISQKLYIEPHSGVALKREVFGPGGARLGYFEFSQIDLNPPPFDPSLFRFERRGVRVVTLYDRMRDIASHNGFQPVTLPPSTGYKLDGVHTSRIEGEQVLVQTFWSHSGKISLFQLKTPVSPERLDRFAGGDLHVTSWSAFGTTFVLVGSIPRDELNRLAQAAGTR